MSSRKGKRSVADDYDSSGETNETKRQGLETTAAPLAGEDLATSQSGRKAKRKKPPGMPRRPLSGYNFFFREERSRWLEERDVAGKADVGNVFSAMGKAIAKRWKKLSPEDGKKYEHLAAHDMERYQREMYAYHSGTSRFLDDDPKASIAVHDLDKETGGGKFPAVASESESLHVPPPPQYQARTISGLGGSPAWPDSGRDANPSTFSSLSLPEARDEPLPPSLMNFAYPHQRYLPQEFPYSGISGLSSQNIALSGSFSGPFPAFLHHAAEQRREVAIQDDTIQRILLQSRLQQLLALQQQQRHQQLVFGQSFMPTLSQGFSPSLGNPFYGGTISDAAVSFQGSLFGGLQPDVTSIDALRPNLLFQNQQAAAVPTTHPFAPLFLASSSLEGRSNIIGLQQPLVELASNRSSRNVADTHPTAVAEDSSSARAPAAASTETDSQRLIRLVLARQRAEQEEAARGRDSS